MIIWGSCQIERLEETGEFACPACSLTGGYTVCRTYRYTHIFFVPAFRHGLLSECVRCDQCGTFHPVTVLAASAPVVASAFAAGEQGSESLRDALGNVVVLSERTAAELRRRHRDGGFGQDAVVRVLPGDRPQDGYQLLFDYAVADGRDWIGESLGIPIIVDRRDAPLLVGKTIDFRDGKFCDDIGQPPSKESAG